MAAMHFNDGQPGGGGNRGEIRKLLTRAMRMTDKGVRESVYWSGVYCLTQDKDDSEHMIGSSWGKRGGLFNRLRKGHGKILSMNDEFWLKFFVITHPKHSKFAPKISEDSKERITNVATKLEHRFHKPDVLIRVTSPLVVK